MRKSIPLALLLFAGHAAGQAPPTPPPGPVTPPYVKLPATKAVKPGRYFCLAPQTNCKSVRWIVPAGLEQIDPNFVLKNPLSVVLVGDAGTYTVSAYGALGDVATDIASCVVTVGVPPPPAPPVPPPSPNDPFVAALQAAYTSETAPTKAAAVTAWAAVYSSAAGMLGNANTVADLLGDIATARAALSPGQLPAVDKVIAAELAAAFGTDGTKALDKVAAKAELTKVAAALGALK